MTATKHSGHLNTKSITRYSVVWFYDLGGVERSYRWRSDTAMENTEKLLKRGFTLKCDPFKKQPLRRVYD